MAHLGKHMYIVHMLVKMVAVEGNQTLYNISYLEIEKNKDYDDNILVYDWIKYFFLKNKICLFEFFAKFLIIKDRVIEKINGFVLEGKTSCGKSLILRTLLFNCNPRDRTIASSISAKKIFKLFGMLKITFQS